MQRYVENKTPNTMYVGNSSIPPGEGRMVEVADVISQPEALPHVPSVDELVAELLKGTVAKVSEALAGLTHEALDRAELLERDGANRTTLLAAIGAEKLQRSNAALEAQAQADRAEQLALAVTDLNAAQAALDAEGDTDKHPALEAAVAEARARVAALSDPAA
ncbi:hypothetical protein [Polaromonas sp.]|uniref:hypothetical protein n=1 Tax=Polaromonas sp. TaxID=1869339 RepID=UPI002731BDE6|nr:hypothetical protein [Polaromonas sp.]MDP1886652.1 hypothetical protein [Polaromonas sp.]